jgi:Mce-associated membrane protein
VPPTRRHPRTTPPPARRPRVAGLRRPSAAPGPQEAEPAQTAETPSPTPDEPEATEELRPAPPVWHEPQPRAEPLDEPAEDLTAEPVRAPAVEEPAEPEPETPEPETAKTIFPRPTGKRRSSGVSRPDDLAEAEAGVRHGGDGTRTNWTLIGTVALIVVAVVLAGLAVWFRGEANSRSEGADTGNQALTDTARASEAIGQLRSAIEKSLTYNYTDLDSTARAVKDNLSGKALCEYDKLFGQVQKLAPEQKLVLTTRVREIGLTRLEGDHAQLLVFVDQTTTRADQNQTTASGAQFAINAERQDNRWKITAFDMLGQPLPNGQPAPQC